MFKPLLTITTCLSLMNGSTTRARGTRMKRIPFLPNVCIAVSLALGITAVEIADPVFISAQMPEPRPGLKLAELLFERTVSQHYIYTVGNRRDPFVPLPFSGSLDDSDAPELSNSGNTEGTVPSARRTSSNSQRSSRRPWAI